jgi:hypothetical protein
MFGGDLFVYLSGTPFGVVIPVSLTLNRGFLGWAMSQKCRVLAKDYIGSSGT